MMYPSYVTMSHAGHAALPSHAPPMALPGQMGGMRGVRDPVVKVEYREQHRIMTPPASDGSMHHSRPSYYSGRLGG
jgi:hypothetical protein